MKREMRRPTMPFNLQRIRIIGMVFLGLLSAVGAEFWFQLSPSLIDVRVCTAVALFALFWSQFRVLRAVFPHVRCMALFAEPLAFSVPGTTTARAQVRTISIFSFVTPTFHAEHCSTVLWNWQSEEARWL